MSTNNQKAKELYPPSRKYVVRVEPDKGRQVLLANAGHSEYDGGHRKVLAIASFVTEDSKTKVYIASDTWGLDACVTLEGMKQKLLHHTVYRILMSVGDYLVDEGKL